MSRDDPIRRGRPILYHWTPAMAASLIERVAAGDAPKEIAYDLGWPPQAVTDQINRLRRDGRLPPAVKMWGRQEEAALIAARDAGAHWNDLIPIFRRTAQAMRQRAMLVRRRMRAEAEQADRDQYQMELRAA